eukprot:m.32334 g.32334  ORF g.32334 m.32334 type:complete len:54 (-) comp14945_c0_seq1:1362-1523(-)
MLRFVGELFTCHLAEFPWRQERRSYQDPTTQGYLGPEFVCECIEPMIGAQCQG